MTFIDKVLKGDVVLEGNGVGGAGGFSADLLERGKQSTLIAHHTGFPTNMFFPFQVDRVSSSVIEPILSK
jgi:hypothetical protein